jgi:hypothetical protein
MRPEDLEIIDDSMDDEFLEEPNQDNHHGSFYIGTNQEAILYDKLLGVKFIDQQMGETYKKKVLNILSDRLNSSTLDDLILIRLKLLDTGFKNSDILNCLDETIFANLCQRGDDEIRVLFKYQKTNIHYCQSLIDKFLSKKWTIGGDQSNNWSTLTSILKWKWFMILLEHEHAAILSKKPKSTSLLSTQWQAKFVQSLNLFIDQVNSLKTGERLEIRMIQLIHEKFETFKNLFDFLREKCFPKDESNKLKKLTIVSESHLKQLERVVKFRNDESMRFETYRNSLTAFVQQCKKFDTLDQDWVFKLAFIFVQILYFLEEGMKRPFNLTIFLHLINF